MWTDNTLYTIYIVTIMQILFSLLILLTVFYFLYIFKRQPRLRLKKWFFCEFLLQRYKVKLTVKYYLKKFIFILIKKKNNDERCLNFSYYNYLRWRKKPNVSTVVFRNKNVETRTLTISFR